MVVRGCGASRIAGGVYVVVPTSPLGMPVEHFLIDPPRAFTREQLRVMGVAAQGMSFVPDPSAETGWSLLDWVGSDHYPNTWDIIAEVKAHGLSRRVQSTLSFDLLGPGSRIYLLHDRAWINDEGRRDLWHEAGSVPGGFVMPCPVPWPEHKGSVAVNDSPMCARLWRECVTGGEDGEMMFHKLPPNERNVVRTVGDTCYEARRCPDQVSLSYTPAIFASFPIHRLDVVRGGKKHDATVSKARKAGLPVEEVDE